MPNRVLGLLLVIFLYSGCYTVADYMKERTFDSKKLFPPARFDAQASQIELDYTSRGPYFGNAISQKEIRSIREEIIDGLSYFIDNNPANSQPARFLLKAKLSRTEWLSPAFGLLAIPIGFYKIDSAFTMQIGGDLYSGSAAEKIFYSAYYNVPPRKSIIARAIVSSLKSAVKNAKIKGAQK